VILNEFSRNARDKAERQTKFFGGRWRLRRRDGLNQKLESGKTSDFFHEYPLEGYQRPAFMILDRNLVIDYRAAPTPIILFV
jgi:hypothetical protein